MSKTMWFGTRGFETWVPAPAPNPSYTRPNFSVLSQYLNGGAGARQSKSAHNAYDLTITPTKKRDAWRLITDFADGVYDTQDDVNLIYWVDPMSRDKNVLNQGWATPSLASEDGVPLITKADGSGRPKAVPTPSNGYLYPARGAQYTVDAASVAIEQYIPIPPGYTAWVGIHGDASAAGIFKLQPVQGYTEVGAAVVPTVLGVTTNQIVNTSIAASGTVSGLVLRFAGVASQTVFTIYGLVVMILKNGVTPPLGNFISGQGHSGCQFIGKPTSTPYGSALDMTGGTFHLEETGMFL
jgi:hypothetical protein